MMQISKNIKIIDTALLINKTTLIINDLHIGYEEALQRKGVLVPRFQLQEIIKTISRILTKIKPNKIIINGDIKHEFGTVLKQEWKEVTEFLGFLLKHGLEIIIIQGNHDPIIKPIAEKLEVKIVSEYRIDDILIIHGDKLVKTDAQRIIIGHEHPAIKLHEKSKWEKYKCFLKGKWQGKELIAVPSFNPLLEGTNILEGRMLSPFLQDVSKFEVYIVNEGEVFKFGKVKEFM